MIGGAFMRKQNFPDNAYHEIPKEYFSPCANPGKVEAVNYTAKTMAAAVRSLKRPRLYISLTDMIPMTPQKSTT